MTRQQGSQERGNLRTQGFALVEVMVAVVILGTILCGVAAALGRAVDATRGLRERAAGPALNNIFDSASTAWTWGPTVEAVEWVAGPELRICVAADYFRPGCIGVWSEGWRVETSEVEADGAVCLGEQIWASRAGQEVVIRVRAGDDGWGPPYRTVVPDVYGFVDLPRAEEAESVSSDGDFEHVGAVAHSRWAGRPSLTASWTSSVIQDVEQVAGFVLATCTEGYCQLDWGGRAQSWVGARERGLDVYW